MDCLWRHNRPLRLDPVAHSPVKRLLIQLTIVFLSTAIIFFGTFRIRTAAKAADWLPINFTVRRFIIAYAIGMCRLIPIIHPPTAGSTSRANVAIVAVFFPAMLLLLPPTFAVRSEDGTAPAKVTNLRMSTEEGLRVTSFLNNFMNLK
jgi:hypothetical protein